LAFTYIKVNGQVQEGLDGEYVYKSFVINSLSDSRILKITGESGEIYLVNFGKLKQLKSLTSKIKVDLKNVDQSEYYNFVIEFVSPVPISINDVRDIEEKELISFSKERELFCFKVSKGTYSLGEYEIFITLKPISSISGSISISINEEIISEKILNFSDISEYTDWGIGIAKRTSTSNINIKSFYLMTEKEEFVKREKGVIKKYDNRFNSTGAVSLTDRDGNVYKTILIGTQTWMAENLKTTKFNDGTSIPLITNGEVWKSLLTPAYCWYNNDQTYKSTYGALYNWYAVTTSKLCPIGWHVPSNAEWTILTNYLGGLSVVGGKLKEAGTMHWKSPNTGATNETGFKALPGGGRYAGGKFNNIGLGGFWWSITEYVALDYYYQRMFNYDSELYGNYNSGGDGFSVRCIKD